MLVEQRWLHELLVLENATLANHSVLWGVLAGLSQALLAELGSLRETADDQQVTNNNLTLRNEEQGEQTVAQLVAQNASLAGGAGCASGEGRRGAARTGGARGQCGRRASGPAELGTGDGPGRSSADHCTGHIAAGER